MWAGYFRQRQAQKNQSSRNVNFIPHVNFYPTCEFFFISVIKLYCFTQINHSKLYFHGFIY